MSAIWRRGGTFALLLLGGCALPDRAAWPVAYATEFDGAAACADFVCSDPARWRWSDAHGRPAFELLGDSRYQPPFRSPTSIALLRDFEFGDFVLEVEVLQTGRDYGHRDLCLFFGFTSPQHFCYVHLAPAPDANAHNVFAVADAPRRNLAPVAARGVDWGNGWHRVRIERRLDAGTVRVFWDDGIEPVLVADCREWPRGRIGFGSFDDSGCIARLRVRAPDAQRVAGDDPFVAGR